MQGLAGVERPLVLAHHDRVEPAVRVGDRRQQPGGFGPVGPGDLPGVADVEELGHDSPAPGDQFGGEVVLPPPRRHRILVVLRRDATVEREPQFGLDHPAEVTDPLRPCGGPRAEHVNVG